MDCCSSPFPLPFSCYNMNWFGLKTKALHEKFCLISIPGGGCRNQDKDCTRSAYGAQSDAIGRLERTCKCADHATRGESVRVVEFDNGVPRRIQRSFSKSATYHYKGAARSAECSCARSFIFKSLTSMQTCCPASSFSIIGPTNVRRSLSPVPHRVRF